MKKRIIGTFIKNNLDYNTLLENVDNVLNDFKKILLDKKSPDKIIKVLYWINNWGHDYIANESTFNSLSLPDYKQRDIIQVHLGFKVGSEQGGLHYAVVMDNNNDKSSSIIMVTPLSSLDENETPDNLNPKYDIYLGNDVFLTIIPKLENKLQKINTKNGLSEKDLKQKQKIQEDIVHLHRGTFAQISQICAVSKQRIYQPTDTGDYLYGLKLSREKFELIKEKINILYL